VKVVLCEDMEHLGDRGQVVNVAAGYARNFLLPKEFALKATPGNMKLVDQRRKIWEEKDAKNIMAAKEFAAKIEAVAISVSKKSGEENTLYGSVTKGDIAEQLESKGVSVDRRKIVIDEPIKTLGNFTVHVKIHREVIADLSVTVIAEDNS
jgi:large subunit ribosomal protein L9